MRKVVEEFEKEEDDEEGSEKEVEEENKEEELIENEKNDEKEEAIEKEELEKKKKDVVRKKGKMKEAEKNVLTQHLPYHCRMSVYTVHTTSISTWFPMYNIGQYMKAQRWFTVWPCIEQRKVV
jgi:hypothetical protein